MWHVFIFAHLLSWTTGVRERDGNVLELLDFHANIFKRSAQIEQTRGHILHIIKQRDKSVLRVVPSGPIYYNKFRYPDWTYEAYLSMSILSIIKRGIELFPFCYFKTNDSVNRFMCFMPGAWKPFCKNALDERTIGSLLGQIPEVPWTGNTTTDIWVIKSVIYSNCGEHAVASTFAEGLVKAFPGNPFYHYLYSEFFSRRDKSFIPDALRQIDLAIALNSSESVYREKRILLLVLNGQVAKSVDDVQWLQKQLDLYLRDKYCSYCVRERVKKPICAIAWRQRLTLSLYHLAVHNTTEAERDLTMALDLIAATQYSNHSELMESVISTLRHLKAIALHNNGKLQEAMDLAILNAHTDPSNMDAVLLVAHTLSRTALYERSLNMIELALPLLDLFSLDSSSASLVQTFTNISLIKRMFFQLRAWVYYQIGDIVQSEQNSQTCLDLLPTDAFCSYVLSLCKLVTGRFVDAVKAAAPVLSRWSDPVVFNSPEFIYLGYLKEWARYLHSHLTYPMVEFHWLSDLPNHFKQNWARSVSLESLPSYTEQPGIDSELPDFTASPMQLRLTLLDQKSTGYHGWDAFQHVGMHSERQLNLSLGCPTSWTLGLLDSGPCQSVQLKNLGQFLCKVDRIFRLFLPTSSVGSSPTVAPLNQRHRLAIALAALHSSESIRNYWCKRRRVSFGTCWSYKPSQNEPRLYQRAPSFSSPGMDDWTIWSSTQCTRDIHSNTPPFSRRQCRTPTSNGPDWFVYASVSARFVQLADPGGAPAFWHMNTHELFANTANGCQTRNPIEDGIPFSSEAHCAAGGSTETECNSHFQSRSSIDSPVHCENDWHAAVVRDQRYFVQHSRMVPDTMPYLHMMLRILSSVFRIRAFLSPDDMDSSDESYLDANVLDLLPSFSSTSSHSVDDSSGQSSALVNAHTLVVSALEDLWHQAGELRLLDEQQQVALNIFVPGRVDLDHSINSQHSAYRYLAGVLLFEKDIDQNYMLSSLLLSNAQHQQELSAELDAAFEEFLIHGEKALASILAGSNSQTDTHRLSSPFEDRYLQDAVNSAFHWLYYWIVSKPLESVYSFHVGFGLVLGMLRALGVEPKASIPIARHSLELEALFVSSPEAFASLCRSLLNLSWLSSSSLALTWQFTPEDLIQHPKMFMEVLNLQAVMECLVR